MSKVDIHVVVHYLLKLATCRSTLLVFGLVYVVGHVVKVHVKVGGRVVIDT
jgi:hypothetical protein